MIELYCRSLFYVNMYELYFFFLLNVLFSSKIFILKSIMKKGTLMIIIEVQ